MIIKLKYLDTPVGSEGVFSDVNGATLKTDAELDLTNWTPDNADWETHDEATFTFQKNKADATGDDAINRLILQDVINRHHTAPASTGGGGSTALVGSGAFPTEDYGVIVSVEDTKFGKPEIYIEGEGKDLKSNAFQGDIKLVEFHGNKVTDNIGTSAFDGCSKLRLVYFSVMEGTIGDNVFHNCVELREAYFPKMKGDVSAYSFEKCSKLNKVSMQSIKGTIIAEAFNSCPLLKDITLNVAMKAKYSSNWRLPAGCVITYLNDDGSVDSTQTV